MSDEKFNPAELVEIMEKVTTIPFARIVDAAGNKEKQDVLLHEMCDNIRKESR